MQPSVSGLFLMIAFGRTDLPPSGEVVGLVIVRHKNAPKATREEIRDWVHQGINPQNTPVFVWFAGEDGVEDEMPLTASGKVQKNVLRERAARWSKLGVGKV